MSSGKIVYYAREMVWAAVSVIAEGAVGRARRWALRGRFETPLSASTPSEVRRGEDFAIGVSTSFPIALARFEFSGDAVTRWEILSMRLGRVWIVDAGTPALSFAPGAPGCERLDLPILYPGGLLEVSARNVGSASGKFSVVWWGIPLVHPHEFRW